MSGNTYVCAIGANYTAQPYINKLIGVLNSMKIKPIYLFWKRTLDDKVIYDEESSPCEIISGFSHSIILLLIGYIFWVIRLFFFALFYGKKDDVFFASRIDSGIPIFLASKVKKFKYIYLDRDAAFLSYNAPKSILFFIKRAEKIIAESALLHFIPGISRDFTKASNVRVIPNSPSSIDLKEAELIRESLVQKDNRFTIYINGWLKKTRGIDFILTAMEKLSKKDFHVLVAGEIGCLEAKQLIALEGVTYLGVLENAQALSLYYQSDVVLSFYDPSIAINQVAEPNKWLDCACLGIKFITNYGISTVKAYVDAGICFQINYGDANELVVLLEKLAYLKESTESLSIDFNLGMLIEPWDIAVRKLLEPYLINAKTLT